MMREGLGVIIGRFQIDELHEGHKKLIQTSINNHKETIVFIGVSDKFNKKNPLPYYFIDDIIKEDFPNVKVFFILDVLKDDKQWSNNLDNFIDMYKSYENDKTLYGSKDSFIDRYYGKYKTIYIEPIPGVSATNKRKEIGNINSTYGNRDFRRGIIWAYNQIKENKNE